MRKRNKEDQIIVDNKDYKITQFDNFKDRNEYLVKIGFLDKVLKLDLSFGEYYYIFTIYDHLILKKEHIQFESPFGLNEQMVYINSNSQVIYLDTGYFIIQLCWFDKSIDNTLYYECSSLTLGSCFYYDYFISIRQNGFMVFKNQLISVNKTLSQEIVSWKIESNNLKINLEDGTTSDFQLNV